MGIEVNKQYLQGVAAQLRESGHELWFDNDGALQCPTAPRVTLRLIKDHNAIIKAAAKAKDNPHQEGLF